jgi:hypothetical protein
MGNLQAGLYGLRCSRSGHVMLPQAVWPAPACDPSPDDHMRYEFNLGSGALLDQGRVPVTAS